MVEVVVDIQIRVVDMRNEVLVTDLRDPMANYPWMKHVFHEVVVVLVEVIKVQASLYEHGDDLAARMQRMKGNDGNAAAKPPRMQRIKEVKEPRVLESLTQIHKDQKHADGGQSDESFHAGFSKPMSSVTPTSFGEFSMINPSGEIDTDVEEVVWVANLNGGATRLFGTDYLNPSSSIGMNMNAFAEGNGVRVSTQAGRFVKVSSSADSGSQQSYGANGPNLSSHDYMHPTGWTLGDQNDLTTETNSDMPIVQSMNINVKPNSYTGVAGASNVNQPKDHANFRPMVAEKVFDGVNILIPRKVVEKGKHGLKRIMMNAKGFFFFKFDTRAGLEAVLEEGPWMLGINLHKTSYCQ
ncbi:hypothetical protein Tco_0850131, partial [Tanacetum coccineum]